MPVFQSPNNPSIIVTPLDDEIVQICPGCTLPNLGTTSTCVNCKYPLNVELGKWVRAKYVQKCSSPTCHRYTSNADSKCEECKKLSQTTTNHTPSADNKMPSFALICPKCKTHNPANANNCCRCKISLEDIDPVCLDESNERLVCLENLHTKKQAKLSLKCDERTLVGKSGALADQFTHACHVSDKHLYLSFNEGIVWICDESTNGTYICDLDQSGICFYNERLHKGKVVPLYNNTIICLGGPTRDSSLSAFFKVTY